MPNKNKSYILVVFLFILAMIIFLLILRINMTGNVVLEEKELITTLIIGDHAGFDLNTTALTFGMIAHGSSSNRKLLIENRYDFPVKFEFGVEGDIAEFLIFEKVVYLEPREKKKIGISTKILENEPLGNYSGKIIIQVKRDI